MTYIFTVTPRINLRQNAIFLYDLFLSTSFFGASFKSSASPKKRKYQVVHVEHDARHMFVIPSVTQQYFHPNKYRVLMSLNQWSLLSLTHLYSSSSLWNHLFLNVISQIESRSAILEYLLAFRRWEQLYINYFYTKLSHLNWLSSVLVYLV